jgi:hypothetical protein
MGRLFVLFALADLALLVIALIDCLSCEGHEIRTLPKAAWVVIILLFSPVGAIVWFLAGRPQRDVAGRPGKWRPGSGFPEQSRTGRQLAPDDDPEFLRGLAARTRRADQERRRREEDLRRREEELRRKSTDETES